MVRFAKWMARESFVCISVCRVKGFFASRLVSNGAHPVYSPVIARSAIEWRVEAVYCLVDV